MATSRKSSLRDSISMCTPRGIRPHQTGKIEPQRLNLQAQNRVNRVFETRDVSKLYCLRTRPTNYIVGKLWLISNFRRKRVPKISSLLKSSASHHKPRRSSVYHPITSPGLRPLLHYLAGSPSSVEGL